MSVRRKQQHKGNKEMYAQFVKSIQINGSRFDLMKLDGVATWCYESGAIVKNDDTLTLIALNV